MGAGVSLWVRPFARTAAVGHMRGRTERSCGSAAWWSAIDRARAKRQGDGSHFQPVQGIRTVAKPELGTKRVCASCGARFYDLNKDPITCPKCGTEFTVASLTPRGRPDAAAARAPVREAEPEPVESSEAEFVSLEEADAEAQGGAKKPVAGDDAAEVEEDVEIDESLDDAAFIEETEDEDTDVTDIIGSDRENEEEG